MQFFVMAKQDKIPIARYIPKQARTELASLRKNKNVKF